MCCEVAIRREDVRQPKQAEEEAVEEQHEILAAATGVHMGSACEMQEGRQARAARLLEHNGCSATERGGYGRLARRRAE